MAMDGDVDLEHRDIPPKDDFMAVCFINRQFGEDGLDIIEKLGIDQRINGLDTQ
jgi:hypothetical protein